MPKSVKQSQAQHFEVSRHAQDRIKIPRVFWTRMKALGLSPGMILRQSNLPITVYGGETRVTTDQLFAIWRTVREITQDPTFGWKGMSELPTDQYHPTILAALHARTYRDCIEKFARYKRLCGVQEFRLTSKEDEVVIEVSWPFAQAETVPATYLEALFALMTELGRRGTKTKLNPKRLELQRPRDPENNLEEYFGCPVKYRSSRDALVLHEADLELPFATHNEELLQMLTPQFEQALSDGGTGQDILVQVKWVLKRLLAGSRPDLVMVARELGVGERTLQRRITEEGTTFRELLNATRHELARQYLSDPLIEPTEAAFLVGFEDPNSFYRAFRTWEGKTPAEWRATNDSKINRGSLAGPI